MLHKYSLTHCLRRGILSIFKRSAKGSRRNECAKSAGAGLRLGAQEDDPDDAKAAKMIKFPNLSDSLCEGALEIEKGVVDLVALGRKFISEPASFNRTIKLKKITCSPNQYKKCY